ncbi:DUF167 domain-containing protein [Candidatus Peregrinibacteria bacterium]|nr:DUF167 domain-containing protein [Candidatus Peregrinibacteria bacterium]MBI3816772.1 DUF167 domain-containing protein [Candidatus Peregrinibacteria bacterium]
MNAPDLRERLASEGSITVAIRTHPGASSTHLKGIMDDGSLRIDLAAAAEDGAANAELIRFLAKECNVPRSAITIVSGATSRRKLVRVGGRSSSRCASS